MTARFIIQRTRRIGMAALVVVGWLLWWTAGARPRPRPPTTIGASCQTSQCHSDYGKRGVSIHRPVRFQKCTFCHKPTRPRLHRFQPVNRSASACFGCHRSRPGLHRHKTPVKGWDCLACHDPHQSPRKKLLRKPATQLCRSCHQSYHQKNQKNRRSVHKPMREGKCLSCHRPHTPSPHKKLLRQAGHRLCVSCHQKELGKMRALAHQHPNVRTQCTHCHRPHFSPHKKLLRRGGNQLCLGCHKDLRRSTTHRDVARAARFHKPVLESCQACHRAHGSAHKGVLKEPANQLCTSCHKRSFAQQSGARSSHSMASPGSCLQCHNPHRSRHPMLQKKAEKKLCLSCHNRVIPRQQGAPVENIQAQLQGKANPHKPIQEGKCGVCHMPHHSSQQQLLRKKLASSFYVGFAKRRYKLCFSCHKATLVTEKRTQNSTRFRNGTLNLHYIHVHKTRRGRNCSVCHDPHASEQPALMRKSVIYGKPGKKAWRLPIRFRKLPHGGSCVSGCHRPKRYHRKTPVQQGYVRYPPQRRPSPRR